MQKGQALIFLLVGMLVIVAVGGAFFLGRSITPKPSPVPVVAPQTPQPTFVPSSTPSVNPVPKGAGETANWKTYKNNTYLYSFAVPPNWSLAENSPDDFKGFFDRQVKTPQEIADTVMGAIVVNKKPSSYATNKDYFDHLYNQTNLEPGTSARKLSINEEPAVMLIEIGEPNTILEGKEGIRVVIYHEGNVFEIGITGKKESIEKNKATFNQILSTFRFD